LGGEFNYASFGDKDHTIANGMAVTTVGAKAWTVEAVARYVLFPEKRINPYFLGGVGVGQVSENAKTKPIAPAAWVDTGTREARTNFDGSATGVAISLGAGVDGYLTESLLAGLDFRWKYLGTNKTFADRAFIGFSDTISATSALSISGKVGYKFGH
jgi:opacity protein-like surface antigen